MGVIIYPTGYKITLEETGRDIGFLIMLFGHWVVILSDSTRTAMVYDRRDNSEAVRKDLEEIYGEAIKIHGSNR